MKKIILSLLFLSILLHHAHSQEISLHVYDPPLQYVNNGWQDWSNDDWVVSPSQPLGRPSGIFRTSNNTLYAAIPDTNINSQRGFLFLLRSTNSGVTWEIQSMWIGGQETVTKVKMVDAGADSIYCIMLRGTIVSVWNISTSNMRQFTTYTNIRDFDAAASSTHSLYLAVDLNSNNDIRLYGSTNGGITWPTNLYLTFGGAIPRMYMSGSGDTCLLNCYFGITADTGSSSIRSWRLAETAPGTLTAASGANVIPEGIYKEQFQPVIYKGRAWIFYTTGTAGNINLNCIQSNDNGATFGTSFTIGALPFRDEYWFDARHYASSGFYGVDLIYCSDSLAGTPTNTSDRLYYTFINWGMPTNYLPPVQISEHWPFRSEKGFIPSIIEFNNSIGDIGAIWVGGPAPYELYFDRAAATSRIYNNQSEIPDKYILSQNFPNPFNPVTTINFSIPKSGHVTIKVFDILGKETSVIVNEDYSAGNYRKEFDASDLSSGVYFYKITAGSFSETKKMVIIK